MMSAWHRRRHVRSLSRNLSRSWFSSERNQKWLLPQRLPLLLKEPGPTEKFEPPDPPGLPFPWAMVAPVAVDESVSGMPMLGPPNAPVAEELHFRLLRPRCLPATPPTQGTDSSDSLDEPT